MTAAVSTTPAILVSSNKALSVKNSITAMIVRTIPTIVSNPKPNSPIKPRVRNVGDCFAVDAVCETAVAVSASSTGCSSACAISTEPMVGATDASEGQEHLSALYAMISDRNIP